VGTGKTTILNVFMRWLHARGASTAMVFNPHLTPDDFLEMMAHDFGVERGSDTKSRWMVRFNSWLLERHHADAPVVLLVDEAQQLSEDVLEELRLLTNLEIPAGKLLQIVLCGQPELDHLLRRPSLRQLRQRISLVCRTAAFTEQQTSEYIADRLRKAGREKGEIFGREASRAVHRFTKGLPRLINALCDEALLDAYCEGKLTVDALAVMKVAREGEFGMADSSAEQYDLGWETQAQSAMGPNGAGRTP
jgi:type II secretory pathway predicted ATPase ExeA